MTEDAAERLTRLLAVIPLFADADSVTHRELELRTGVPAAQLLDDLRALTERWDTPGAFVEDLRVEFERNRMSVHTSHFRRPMRLTISELCALELGLALRASTTAPDERPCIERARAKLRHVIVTLPGDPKPDAWHVPVTKQSGDFVAVLQRAVKSTTKVRITYQSSHARQREARVVHPYAVVPARGTWYVVARCERSDAVKFFRVDRITSADLLDDRFECPASLPVVELIRTGKPFQSGGSDSMVVRYSPRIARWIAEREGKSVDADGSITIEHPLADDTWAIRHVLQYGPEAEVLAPSRLRQQVKETLQAITH